MKTHLLLAFLLLGIFSYAQENRKAFTLEIAADATQQYEAAIPESPYFVKENILQIYCGEKLFVECEVVNDKIASMKVVEKNSHPEKTIEIEFTQNTKDRSAISTMLLVKNPFAKSLKYEAMLFTPLGQEWKRTSIIPVQPKLMSFEMWSHAIVTLVLENWRLE
jgi:hypothetical protein